VCSVPITPTANSGVGGVKSYTQRLQVKEMTSPEVVSVNMHLLGESFVEKVSDVRRRATVDGQAAAPGESLEFLAHIRGCQSEARKQRRDKLLQLNSGIGLRVALTGAVGADIFFIQEIHFAGETPELDDEGWWYQVRTVIWCRECRKCRVRKEQEGFQRNEWNKEQLAICARCVTGTDSKWASTRMTRKVRKRMMMMSFICSFRNKNDNNTPNPRARRPRAAQGQGVEARDVTSESEEDEEEGVEWSKRMYGVRMSPAHPQYVGRGNDTCGGEVVYTIPEIRTLLRSQPEDTTRRLTTSQMGWALTREENEIINEKDEREGRPVARQLASMISTRIRAQWESGELEDVDDERRQILEEASEFDHIWGVWEGEKELTKVPREWIRQPSQSGNDMRHHVEVHASHREKEWESQSALLIEKDPAVVPDMDIAVHVGRDFFLDEKIPRHESGQGYVRVVEHSVRWKETAASKIFTYQGSTTCTEIDKSWTIMSSAHSHLRQGGEKNASELKTLIRAEVEQQERLPSAGRGTTRFWGQKQGPTVFLWDSLGEEGREECERVICTHRDWVVWS
jgi:hypothetical protein